jgi:hypothetical protein
MPSSRNVVLIVLFWLLTTGYIAYRDIWPVLFASGPPPIAIELADEAAQHIPIRWKISWNGKDAGRLITQMRYVENDDTFRFVNDYKNLRIDVMGVTMSAPEFTTSVRVTRAGDLREQTAEGKLEMEWNGVKVAGATAKLAGTVSEGKLTTKLDGSYTVPLFGTNTINRTLDPVAVPVGQPLNPLQPVNRIRGVKPGRQWVVNESDPMKDVVEALEKELKLKLPDEKREPLVGEVLSEAQELHWGKYTDACWVIEYRRGGEVIARTWVHVSDSKVLKQEAFHKGDTVAIEREE